MSKNIVASIFFVKFSLGVCAFLFQDGENHMLSAHRTSLIGEQKMNMLNSRGGVSSYLKQVSVYIVP